MSRQLRDLETKSGRGLLRGGRSGSNHSSIFAGAARTVLRARQGQLSRRIERQGQMHDRISHVTRRLQFRATTDANPNRRRLARVALYGGAGAIDKLQRAKRRLGSSMNKYERTARSLRHFGG